MEYFAMFLIGFIAGMWVGWRNGWNGHTEFKRVEAIEKANAIAEEEKQ